MRTYYHKKYRLLLSLILSVGLIAFIYMNTSQFFDIITHVPTDFVEILLILQVYIPIILFLYFLIYNIFNALHFNENAKLVINFEEKYLIYEIKDKEELLKINIDDVNMIYRYSVLPVLLLYYDEIIYTENNVRKKIIVSSLIIYKFEKKIKHIKKIKVEDHFVLTINKFKSCLKGLTGQVKK